MRRSDDCILTTQTGSLPRPPELTRPYIRRARGESVDAVNDSLINFFEHPEAVADRLERAAAAIGDPRRVIGGTDCGFDTSAGMGRVAEDVVWAKLESRRRRPRRLCAVWNGRTCTR